METPENNGGESGGPALLLSRSELAILRKYSSRYSIVDGERQEAVECVMDTMRKAKSLRTKLSAVNTLAALDRTNLDEMKAYLAARKIAGEELKPAETHQTNIQVNVNTVESALTEPEYLEYLRTRALENDSDPGPVRTNGKPGPVENGKAPGDHRPGTNGCH